MRKREVGTLWIGGKLSWMEQLCLKSFVDAGQKVTLFHYHPIPNTPEGVILRDGREVIDTEDFLKHRRKNSYALFADRFRLHMIRANPGMIWIDTDVYCQRPMRYHGDYVMGFEKPGGRRVNNAVLGLPADSAILADMIAFTDQLYPQPAFVKPALRAEYRAAAKAGNPVHVADMPWGTWGPNMLSWFVKKHDLRAMVRPIDAFYPVTFPERRMFIGPVEKVDERISKATTALHVWASNKAEIGGDFGGYPPPGSWFDLAVRRHDIHPEWAPVRGRGYASYAGGLADERIAQTPVTRFADIGGQAAALALTLHARYGSGIDLIDLPKAPGAPGAADIAAYRRFLGQFGVAPDAIRHITDPADLRPVDLAAWLGGSPGGAGLRDALGGWLGDLLPDGAELFTDLAKGDGGFVQLRRAGQARIIGAPPETTGARFCAHLLRGAS